MNLKRALNQPLINRNSLVQSTGMFGFFGGVQTKKGTPVNATTSLTLSAFFNGIEIICNDYAILPKAVFKKVDDGREKISDHAVAYLMSGRPNKYMTRFVFDKLMIKDAILKGNGYAEIIRNTKTGVPVALEYIDQSKEPVTVVKTPDGKFYKIGNRMVQDSDMIHILGFTENGITGIGIVTFAAMSLGVSLSSQEFASEYYNHKGINLGVVETEKYLDGPQKEKVRTGISNAFAKADLYNTPVLDDGLKYKQLTITPQEARFLETNKFGIEEVARWLNIPPHKLKSLENATYSNIDNQSIQHVSDSIMPWSTRSEQEYTAKLFTSSESKQGYYIRYNVAVLLKANPKDKGEFYSKMVFAGTYTRNEVRAFEDMNSLPGLDEPLTPVNVNIPAQIEKSLKDE